MQKTKTYIPTAFSASSNGEAGCLSALENNLKENIGITNLKLYLEMKNAKLKFALMAMLLCLCTAGRGQTFGPCGVSSIDGEYGYDTTVPFSVVWSYGDGALTITRVPSDNFGSASGYMGNFSEEGTAPWLESEDFDPSEITSIILDGVKSIGDEAFAELENLVDVYFVGNSVEKIGVHAFYACTSLTSIDIPGSVKIIDDEAFSGCYSLSEVTFHEGLEEIGVSAFYFCNLENIILPDGLESIGETSFMGCGYETDQHIRNVVIPASLSSVGPNAFDYTDIDYLAYLPANSDFLTDCVDAELFMNIYKVTASTALDYDTDDEWKEFVDVYFEGDLENVIQTHTINTSHDEGKDFKVGTICLPFESYIDASDWDVCIYEVLGKDGNAIALRTVPAANNIFILQKGVPYIYKTEKDSLSLPFLYAGTSVCKSNNGLIGNLFLDDVLVPAGCYAVYQNQFVLVHEGQKAKVGQFKAYLDPSQLPTISNAKERNCVLWYADGTFEGDETSVNGVCDAAPAYAVGTYSVDGVKRAAKQKGLNIVKMSDGSVKKVMVE